MNRKKCVFNNYSQNSVVFHLLIYLFLKDILKKSLRVTNSAKTLLYLEGFFTFSLFSRNVSVLKGTCLTLYKAKQWTSFDMIGTSIVKELIDLNRKLAMLMPLIIGQQRRRQTVYSIYVSDIKILDNFPFKNVTLLLYKR